MYMNQAGGIPRGAKQRRHSCDFCLLSVVLHQAGVPSCVEGQFACVMRVDSLGSEGRFGLCLRAGRPNWFFALFG